MSKRVPQIQNNFWLICVSIENYHFVNHLQASSFFIMQGREYPIKPEQNNCGIINWLGLLIGWGY